MEKYNIIVTAASGIEGVTKRELKDLGIQKSCAINGKIGFEGSLLDVARCNMFLRTADKVMIKLSEFPALTFDELYEGVISLPWEDLVDKNGKYTVNGKCVKSTLFAVSACQSIIKKAIIERLKKHYNTTQFPEDGNEYHINFNLFENNATLALNTSGNGLHKRGYRDLVGEAPLKETLASALILLSNWNAEKPFIDPFCGSGTLPVEAAMIASNIAPGLNREFAFENYGFFDNNIAAAVREEAKCAVKADKELRISGFDIDPEVVKIALRHAERAGVRDSIHLQVQDVEKLSSRYAFGTIVTNPPYGERLLNTKSVKKLYNTLGNVYRSLDRWSLFAITSAIDFESSFGKTADKTRRLYNAKMECRYYCYINK